MAEPSVHMMEAFGMGVGSPHIECICGRQHCCPDSAFIEEDEAKEMRESAKAYPKKYVIAEGYDSVSAKCIGGATVVPDCECQYMVKLERLLWAERRNILAYYKHRRDADAQQLRDLDDTLADHEGKI